MVGLYVYAWLQQKNPNTNIMNKEEIRSVKAGVAKSGNGAGLRTLFLVIRGFKSLPPHLIILKSLT